MTWYDWFSRVYDASLEPLYAEQRQLSAEALGSGSMTLDVPCGTGQSLAPLRACSGPGCLLLGVDASAGMLTRARERVDAHGWQDVRLLEGDAARLDAGQLSEAAGQPVQIDRLHVFLGMSVFDDMQAAFERLWSLLVPGGRCVLVDVHAERLGLQGWMVNRIARADIRRRFWEPLAAVAQDVSVRDLPYRREHGGQIMLATGVKPAA